MSEDCLLINVWTPVEERPPGGLPMLVYIHGGALLVGDGSEPRYDGASLAARGLVVATVNFRLGVFGFLAHPDLEGANAGLFDLLAAIAWLQTNAAAFGGDSSRMTLAGCSSGAYAALVLAASHHLQGRIAGLMVQSASLLGSRLLGAGANLPTLETARRRGASFARTVGGDLAALKAMPVDELLRKSSAGGWNLPVIDGDVLPQQPLVGARAGAFRGVRLLTGSTSAERSFDDTQGTAPVGPDDLRERLRDLFGDRSEEVIAAYGAPWTSDQCHAAWQRITADAWIGADILRLCRTLDGAGPVYAYLFDQSRPAPLPGSVGWTCAVGAGHSTDVEYFLGNQSLSPDYPWTDADKALSEQMQAQVAAFVAKGDPNGSGLPVWPRSDSGRRVLLSSRGGQCGFEATSTLSHLLETRGPLGRGLEGIS